MQTGRIYDKSRGWETVREGDSAIDRGFINVSLRFLRH